MAGDRDAKLILPEKEELAQRTWAELKLREDRRFKNKTKQTQDMDFIQNIIDWR